MEKHSSKKRAGIISLYYGSLNLGGLLQSYAMTRLLKELDYDAEQICYKNSGLTNVEQTLQKRMKKELFKKVGIRKILSKFYHIMIQPIVKIQRKRIQSELRIQKKKFQEFEDFIPHSEKYYDASDISTSNKEYDIFVTGSDQVWNPRLLSHKAYFLEFVEKEKKIAAYAVSSGKYSLTGIERFYFGKYIEKFRIIGVREKSLQTLLASMGKKSEVVLDPTLLISKEEWLELADFSIIPKEKYIFCYFLGDTIWQRRIIAEYAKIQNLKVIHLPYIMGRYRFCDKYLNGEGRYDVGPRQFLAFIHNAECIVTDSFHAMIFSVLFQKEFFVFDRNGEKGGMSMNGRICDFLEMFHLERRHIKNQTQKMSRENIDYEKMKKIFLEKQQQSFDFLKKELLE